MSGFLEYRRRLAFWICPEILKDMLMAELAPMDFAQSKDAEQQTDISANVVAIVRLAEVFARHAGRSEATISNWIVGHARLFSRLRAGHGTTVKTFYRTLDWFSGNWPDDLDWPSDIQRPEASK